jgi:hypothetical protein
MTGKSTVNDNQFKRHITLLCKRLDKGYTIECAYVKSRTANMAANGRNREALRLHIKYCEKRGLDWEKYWKGDPYFTKSISIRDYGSL